MSKSDASYLSELLASADTPEDLRAIEELIAEQEQTETLRGKWVCRTLAEVAEFFGLAVQTVKQWRMESPAMPGSDGQYPLREIVQWRLNKLAGSSVLDAKRQADLESIRLVNEKRAMENAHKRGLLIEREEVERDMSLLWSRLAARLTGIADRIATIVPAEMKGTAKERVEQEIRIIQKEFVDSLGDLA
jgi:hypothetical protein